VLNRPDNEPRQRGTVAPGAYGFKGAAGAGRIPEGNYYDVVWWDPSALHLDASADRGVRHLDLLDKDAATEVVEASLAENAAWADAKRDAVERGSRQTSVVMTAGERARRGGLPPPAQPVELLGPRVQATHPPGRRFGTLVHAVLAIVPLDGDEPTIQDLAAQQGVLAGATPGEIESAAAAVASVLQHDLLARARAAQARGACRRETPVMWREDAGREGGGPLVEGVVDLAFEEEAGWTVVDFKTDHDLRRGLERYRRQVALYADIIARATRRPATGVLLRV
jgi:ATP-dependent exoDNAse (exonuclease V) beta subunit